LFSNALGNISSPSWRAAKLKFIVTQKQSVLNIENRSVVQNARLRWPETIYQYKISMIFGIFNEEWWAFRKKCY